MAESESLSYAVRPRVVGAYLGQLMVVVAALWTVPVAVAAVEREWSEAAVHAATAAALAALGWLIARRRPGADLQVNEALVAVAAAFIVTPLVLAAPMMLAGIGYLDALFEAVSGITTTGLSTLATVADKPRALIFAAAWLQWIGGAAIVVLSFVLLFGQSASARRLTGVVAGRQDVVGGTRAYATVVIRIYLALTAIGVVALLVAGAGWFPSLALTLAAVSTGGFSPFDHGLDGESGAVRAVVILICLTGAIAVPLYQQALSGKWRSAIADPELSALFLAALAAAVLLLLHGAVTPGSPPPGDLLFTAFSAETTAGFATTPVSALDPFSKAVLIATMTIGGSVGSSAGGIKLLRLIVFVRLMQLMILRSRLTPRAAVARPIAGRDWDDPELTLILVFIGLFFAVVAVSWLIFLWFGYAPLDSLFEVTSATATVGLSSGVTGPHLPAALKGVLCADMLLGRLEVLPLLVLVAPRTWIGQRRAVAVAANDKTE